MITGFKYGSYLKDPMPRRKGFADKVWVTKNYFGNLLFEYETLEDITSNTEPRVYRLPKSYYGTGHVIYQGSFYYHSHNTDTLIRYDLHLKKVVAEVSLKLSKNDTNEQHCRVYSDHREHVGCFDFSVDENGLWVIYRNGSRNNIYVAKLNVDDMTIQKTVTIRFTSNELRMMMKRSIQNPTSKNRMNLNNFPALYSKTHQKRYDLSKTVSSSSTSGSGGSSGLDEILNGFIICGKIYFLQYHGSQNTVIRLMFDLYNVDNKFSYLQSIEFIQPYKKNTQLTYNPYDQKLYAWDSEHLITYSLELV